MAIEQTLLDFYLYTTLLSAGIFVIIFAQLLLKYLKKGNRLHMWAMLGFLMLVVQESIVLNWVIVVNGFFSRPWQLQTLSLMLSLALIGLAMTGKIKD